MAEQIKLDGREFHGITQSLSANQDDYVVVHLRLSGATEVVGDIDKKRTRAEKREELITRVMDSGRKYKIIAGFLTEVGKKWTRAEADRNAEIFSEITDATEKQTMQTAIVRFVIDFFQQEARLSKSSQKSSSQQENADPDTSSADPGTSASLPS